MKKAFIGFLAVVLGMSHGHAQEANPSPYKTRDIPVGSFDRIEVSGPFMVWVISDSPAQVQLSGPPALLSDTEASVRDGTLIIRFRDGANWSWNPGSGVNVTVRTPSLRAVSASGAARIEVHGMQGEEFSAATNGSGSIAIEGLSANEVNFAVSGSGSIRAEGTAEQAQYAIGGSGSIESKRLRVENADIAVGGSGSVHADVSDLANIAVRGSGAVEVVGGAQCIKSPPDSPRIVCR